MNKNFHKYLEIGSFFKYKDYKIFYYQEGKGENLLIIHGYPFGSYEWKEVLPHLSDKYRVTVFDLLGMGFSDKPENHKYSYEEYCEIVNSLLDFLKISNTHILSHDLGVSIVQELICWDLERKNRFQINSIAFVNGSLFIDVYKPRLIQRLLSQTPHFIGKTLSKKIPKNAIFKSVKSVYGKDTQPTENFLDEQWEILNYNNGKSITHLIGRLVFEKKNYLKIWVNGMQKTKIPMCYICGPSDPNSGLHMAKRYEELINNPKIFLMSNNIGHWPFLEDKEGFLVRYNEFLESIIENKKD